MTRARPARRPRHGFAPHAIVLAVALCTSGAALAAMYKWVDEKGVVHYTDKVPPDAVNKGSVQLSPQGIPIKKVAPAIPLEQRQASEAEQERQREAAKAQAEIARRDRALRDSYTTESDIDLARSRALKTVRAALESAEAYSATLEKRRAALVGTGAANAGKPSPPNVARDVAVIDAELARQEAVIAQKRQQLADVAAKYDADKARWRGLKEGDSAAPPPAASASRK